MAPRTRVAFHVAVLATSSVLFACGSDFNENAASSSNAGPSSSASGSSGSSTPGASNGGTSSGDSSVTSSGQGGSASGSGTPATDGARELVSSFYGVPWNADGLTNLRPGYQGLQVDYRFRAQKDGAMNAVKIFLTWGDAGGYSDGNGGDLKIELRADDGTADHLPASTALATAVLKNPKDASTRGDPIWANSAGDASFRVVRTEWDVKPTLVAGFLYHLVFTNSDPNHETNYISLDNLANDAETPDMQPAVSDVDLAVHIRHGTSEPWEIRYFDTPVYEIHYADGTRHGQGYMGTTRGYGHTPINGSTSIRELFTVSGGSRTVKDVSLRVTREGDPGDLHIRLEDGGGNLIEEGIVLASSIDTTMRWVKYTFRTPLMLADGATYKLVATATGFGGYETWALQDGEFYGFETTNLFRDGVAQVNYGSGWENLEGGNDYDWQMYFTTSP